MENISIKELHTTANSNNLKFDKGVIYIPNFYYEKIEVYLGDNIFLCEIDREEELDYIRCQIKDNSLTGCYFMFQGKKFEIDSNGMIPLWSNKIFSIQNFCSKTLFDLNFV